MCMQSSFLFVPSRRKSTSVSVIYGAFISVHLQLHLFSTCKTHAVHVAKCEQPAPNTFFVCVYSFINLIAVGRYGKMEIHFRYLRVCVCVCVCVHVCVCVCACKAYNAASVWHCMYIQQKPMQWNCGFSKGSNAARVEMVSQIMWKQVELN